MSFAPLGEKELKKRYGKFFRRRRDIKKTDVPRALQPLIPYAEVWGTGDDNGREELTDIAPDIAIEDLVAIFAQPAVNRALDDWLGQPKKTNIHSDAYQGFSCLRLAFYSVDALRQWKRDNES